jgi:hypothetical protein
MDCDSTRMGMGMGERETCHVNKREAGWGGGAACDNAVLVWCAAGCSDAGIAELHRSGAVVAGEGVGVLPGGLGKDGYSSVKRRDQSWYSSEVLLLW